MTSKNNTHLRQGKSSTVIVRTSTATLKSSTVGAKVLSTVSTTAKTAAKSSSKTLLESTQQRHVVHHSSIGEILSRSQQGSDQEPSKIVTKRIDNAPPVSFVGTKITSNRVALSRNGRIPVREGHISCTVPTSVFIFFFASTAIFRRTACRYLSKTHIL